MAQGSAFHEGSTIGDAVLTSSVWGARYSPDEWADILYKLLASQTAYGYVVPRYANDLEVVAGTGMAVTLESGCAFVAGRIYENTANLSLTLSASHPTLPRIDRVILRYDPAAQTIRAVILEGTSAATPTIPALTQSAVLYEVTLAYVYISAAVISITTSIIHDERVFIPSFDEINKAGYQSNLIKNSEFMGEGEDVANLMLPWHWDQIGTPVVMDTTTRFSSRTRGRTLLIRGSSSLNAGISQTIRVKPNTLYSLKYLFSHSAITQVAHRITVVDDSGTLVTKDLFPISGYTSVNPASSDGLEGNIRFTTSVGATFVTVSFLANIPSVYLGQILLLEGYVPGPFREVRETLIANQYIWDSVITNSSSSGPNTISFTEGIKNYHIHLSANDSGSAAGSASILSGGARIQLDGVPNDKQRYAFGIAPSIVDSVPWLLSYTLVASGASTFDAVIRMVGMEI